VSEYGRKMAWDECGKWFQCYVILSEVTPSLGEGVTRSKDPYV